MAKNLPSIFPTEQMGTAMIEEAPFGWEWVGERAPKATQDYRKNEISWETEKESGIHGRIKKETERDPVTLSMGYPSIFVASNS